MGCNSSAGHADNEGYVLPSGVVCFTPKPLMRPSDPKNRWYVQAKELPRKYVGGPPDALMYKCF